MKKLSSNMMKEYSNSYRIPTKNLIEISIVYFKFEDRRPNQIHRLIFSKESELRLRLIYCQRLIFINTFFKEPY